MYWIASPTVTIFSASSSGIWMSKCSTMISFTFSSTGFAMNRSPPPKGELHIETAVDVEHLARDVGRPVSGEESYHLGHLERGADALERHLRHEIFACRRRNVRGHVGLDQPGSHRIHEDRPVRQLARRRLREADEARLRRGVVH